MLEKDLRTFKEDVGNWLSCRMAHAKLRIRYYSGISRVSFSILLYSFAVTLVAYYRTTGGPPEFSKIRAILQSNLSLEND